VPPLHEMLRKTEEKRQNTFKQSRNTLQIDNRMPVLTN
jgi:hypothetical protein